MTATVASSHVPHSTLSIPTTQNTAPIIEHQCLYTHDLKRKQKRWQDGLLRFHTFNKRVMVYDVPRNYIGDTHWRDVNPVQDGDEFELDRGILIQVGEAVGKVDQDLTELLEKRRKAPEIPARVDLPDPTFSNTTNAPSINTSQMLRPKPLNAVLGTPRGQLGRATLTSKSPHDLRVESENQVIPEERVPKRRRLGSLTGTARVRTIPTSIERPIFNVPPIHEKVNGPQRIEPLVGSITRAQKSTDSATATLQKSYHIQGDCSNHSAHTIPKDHGAKHQSKKVPKQAGSPKPIHILSSQEEASSIHHRVAKARQPTKERLFASSKRSKCISAEETEQDQNRAINRTSLHIPALKGNQSLDRPRKRMKLQIASTKPRKKLMYRDLLPLEPPYLSTSVQRKQPSMTSDTGMVKNRRGSNTHPQEPPAKSADQSDSNKKHGQKHAVSSLEGMQMSATTKTSNNTEQMLESPGVSLEKPDEVRNNYACQPSHNVLHAPLPKPKASTHDTNLALSKMDEILLSKIQRDPRAQKPDSLLRSCVPQPADESGINSKKALHETTCSRPLELMNPLIETQVPSSQSNLQQSPQTNQPAPPVDKVTEIIISSQSIQSEPSPPPSPTKESPKTPSIEPPAKETPQNLPPTPAPPTQDPSLTQPGAPETALLPLQKPLPSFRKPTRRSPLKKAVSDLSSMRPAPEAPTSAIAKAAEPTTTRKHSKATEQSANPWSKEAWDLFGCGPDGKECGFEAFVEKLGCG